MPGNKTISVKVRINDKVEEFKKETEEKLKTEKNIVGNNSSGYFKVLKNAIKNKLAWQYKENKNIRILVVYTDANCNQSQTYSIFYPEVETAK